MDANKVFVTGIVKTLVLAIPLVLAYMFGISWLFNWLSDVHGVDTPRWLASFLMLGGVFGIVGLTVGGDYAAMKRVHKARRPRKRK